MRWAGRYVKHKNRMRVSRKSDRAHGAIANAPWAQQSEQYGKQSHRTQFIACAIMRKTIAARLP
jgi:hypothetical protein